MKKSRQIAYCATFIALIFVALMLDTAVGSVLPIKPAIFSLPAVFVFSLMFGKWQFALIGGTAFGLLSFARAFITGSVPFQNPLVSILPRIIIGFILFGLYSLGRVIFARAKRRETLAIGFASMISVVLHTLIVMLAMFAFENSPFSAVFGAIISFNFPVELIVTTFLTPFLTLGVRRGLRINVDRTKDKENGNVTGD